MTDGPKGTLQMEGGAPTPEGAPKPEIEGAPKPLEDETLRSPVDPQEAPRPKVAPTVVDEPVPAAPSPAPFAEEAPWARAGKTQPGEPPVFDAISPAPAPVAPVAPVAPGAFPAPIRPAPPPMAPAPVFYPPPVAPRGGSSLGLILGGLIGGMAVVGGIIALVVVMRANKDDEPVNPIPISTGPATEVKPDTPATAEAQETPPPSPEPVATPSKTATPASTSKPKPKPKSSASSQPPLPPPPQPTQPKPQPDPTLPPPPPPAPTSTGGKLKWKKKPQ